MSIYLSSGAFQARNLMQVVSDAMRLRIKNIELSSGLSHTDDVLDTLNSANNINYLVHNYFPSPHEPFVLNLASLDETIHMQSIALCHRAIDLSAALNAPYYSVHAGFCFHLTPEMLGDPITQSTVSEQLYVPYAQAYDHFVATIIELAQYANDRNVGLMVENNVVSSAYLAGGENKGLLIAEPTEMLRFIQDVEYTGVKLLVDTGHLKVSATALNFDAMTAIEYLSDHIGALHLSDNDGIYDTNEPITTSSWFYPLLSQLTHLPWVIEAYTLTDDEIAQQFELLRLI